jgi:hypothetical protein
MSVDPAKGCLLGGVVPQPPQGAVEGEPAQSLIGGAAGQQVARTDPREQAQQNLVGQLYTPPPHQ